MSEPIELVINVVGRSTTHVVAVRPEQIHVNAFEHFGATFTGIELPLVTACGSTLRSRHGVAVVMEQKTKVRCRYCKRLSGLTEQPSSEYAVPHHSERDTASRCLYCEANLAEGNPHESTCWAEREAVPSEDS